MLKKSQQLRIVTLSLLLFVLTQYSALLHASTHFFHTPDEQCAIFSAVEHNKPVIGSDVSAPVIALFSDILVIPRYELTGSVWSFFVSSRAPPRL